MPKIVTYIAEILSPQLGENIFHQTNGKIRKYFHLSDAMFCWTRHPFSPTALNVFGDDVFTGKTRNRIFIFSNDALPGHVIMKNS